jgi:hypothetical protein
MPDSFLLFEFFYICRGNTLIDGINAHHYPFTPFFIDTYPCIPLIKRHPCLKTQFMRRGYYLFFVARPGRYCFFRFLLNVGHVITIIKISPEDNITNCNLITFELLVFFDWDNNCISATNA